MRLSVNMWPGGGLSDRNSSARILSGWEGWRAGGWYACDREGTFLGGVVIIASCSSSDPAEPGPADSSWLCSWTTSSDCSQRTNRWRRDPSWRPALISPSSSVSRVLCWQDSIFQISNIWGQVWYPSVKERSRRSAREDGGLAELISYA